MSRSPSIDARHRSADLKAKISTAVRVTIAKPETLARREAVVQRRRQEYADKVKDFLRIDRSCAVCGCTLTMKNGETLWRFKDRKTCSSLCAHRLQGLAMVATKRLLCLQKPKRNGIWPEGVNFAEHESAEAAADRGSRRMPSAADLHSLCGTASALCAEHRWAGL